MPKAKRKSKVESLEEQKIRLRDEMEKMFEKGLCGFCIKKSKCKLVEQFGECAPKQRCVEFVCK